MTDLSLSIGLFVFPRGHRCEDSLILQCLGTTIMKERTSYHGQGLGFRYCCSCHGQGLSSMLSGRLSFRDS